MPSICARNKNTDKPLKIALFLPDLTAGGAEMVTLSLARGFIEHGVAVDLVVATARGPLLSRTPRGVRLIDLGTSRIATSLPFLVAYLRRERPMAMLSTLGHANIIALWAKKISRVPLRLAIREATTSSATMIHPSSLRSCILRFLVRRCYPWATIIIAVSNGVAKDMVDFCGLPRERIQTIYNPVDTAELMISARESVAHPWFFPGEPPVILGVGRLVSAKDYPTLIRAFALVRKKKDSRLILLGEGGERQKLEALISQLGLQEDVDMPGFVPNPISFMAKSAVFVLSSIREGMPNVLIQAMAIGTRIVATDCPSGPREVLQDGRHGTLVPMGDEYIMAEAIAEAMCSKSPYVAVPDMEKFSSSVVIRQYLQLLLGDNYHE